MKCIVVVLVVGSFFLKFCIAFNSNVNRTLQFTALENIVKRGIHRLCDEQTDNVLKKCKRPIVRVSDYDSDFDLHTRVGRTISEVLNLDVDQVNDRLCNEIKKELSTIGSCKIVHDGLNIKLIDQYMIDQLDHMLEGDRLGVGNLTNERVVVDYFSPNVGKMLHMGHIRSLAIGQSLSNLLEFSGSKVFRRNHIGDFGLQSGIIMRYLMEYDVQAMEALDSENCDRERLLKKTRALMNYTVPVPYPNYRVHKGDLPEPPFAGRFVLATMDTFYKMACEKFASDPEFSKRARIEANLLQNSKSFSQVQWQNVTDQTLGHYNDILDFYYMKGLKHIPESFYRNVANKLLTKLLNEGKAKEVDNSVVYDLADSSSGVELDEERESDSKLDKHGEVSDSSVNEDSSKSDSMNKSVLRTKDGTLTYMATDLAALSHRVDWNKPDRIIYVTDKNQKSHFEKLYKISKKLDILKDCEMEHIGFGQITLEGSGKIRSRSGTNCSLVEITKKVVDLVGEDIVKRGDYMEKKRPVLSRKIGVGSLIFSDLSVEPGSGYNFSIERLMNQGNNSLMSILYSYVRSLSILRKSEGLENLDDKEFRNQFERRLGRSLLGFENTVLTALAMREPHRISKYLFNLSKEFGQFYQNTPVIVDNKVHSQSLKLVKLTSKAIELGLKILNIQPVTHL